MRNIILDCSTPKSLAGILSYFFPLVTHAFSWKSEAHATTVYLIILKVCDYQLHTARGRETNYELGSRSARMDDHSSVTIVM